MDKRFNKPEPIDSLKVGDIVTDEILDFYKGKDYVRFYTENSRELKYNPFRFNVKYDATTKGVLLIWKG